MGTLSSELAPHAERLSPRPRIYADANVPAGAGRAHAPALQWDVLFVLEDAALRRAPDVKHYRLAQQLRRTLVTLDRDYLDDRRFPPRRGPACSSSARRTSASCRRCSIGSIRRCSAARATRPTTETAVLPLAGRKLHAHTDWGRDA